jgi:hypothetical protein
MMTPQDQEHLSLAHQLLESQSLATRLTHLIGTPIEEGIRRLPRDWQDRLAGMTEDSLSGGLRFVLETLSDAPGASSWRFMHKAAAATSGAIGGAMGLAALAIELPLSTLIMLRSIAAIARSEGEPLQDPEARLACLQVFALGGPSSKDDAAETGYFAIRAATSATIANAARHLVTHGMEEKSAPVVLRLIAQIAQRFGVQVTEKAAAQALPLIGAIGGAAINTLFIDHYQDKARGHFLIRRLERQYDPVTIESAYRALRN